jgi:hypothetical protein
VNVVLRWPSTIVRRTASRSDELTTERSELSMQHGWARFGGNVLNREICPSISLHRALTSRFNKVTSR